MPLVILALGLYIIFAEWRNVKLRIKLDGLDKNLGKLKRDKTIWYSGVLPKADKLCLFQENGGEYLVSKLSDIRWKNKDGLIDFSKIKRWAYIDDLNNI